MWDCRMDRCHQSETSEAWLADDYPLWATMALIARSNGCPH
jgi:hypothetical protein